YRNSAPIAGKWGDPDRYYAPSTSPPDQVFRGSSREKSANRQAHTTPAPSRSVNPAPSPDSTSPAERSVRSSPRRRSSSSLQQSSREFSSCDLPQFINSPHILPIPQISHNIPSGELDIDELP